MYSKTLEVNNLKTRYLDCARFPRLPRAIKQNFLMFVQFGEKLRSKRFDPKYHKTTLFELLKALIDCQNCLQRKQTSVMFVQFGEILYLKTFEVNDLKTRYLDSPRPKHISKTAQSETAKFRKDCAIWCKLVLENFRCKRSQNTLCGLPNA